MQDFRQLEVWKKDHRITIRIYAITRGFPQDERFGLVTQLRRACVSIGANLAEGCCRNTDKDFARFVDMSLGSASEVEYSLLPAHELGYIPDGDYQELNDDVQEVKRMLAGLNRRLRKTPPADS